MRRGLQHFTTRGVNLRGLDYISQFRHLRNGNTSWRHRLMHNRFLRTGNRECSSLDFCVGNTVFILSLSGASLFHLGRNRAILHVWPGSKCTRTITDEPYIDEFQVWDLQDGPRSPANTSQITLRPVCGAKCFKQAPLIFSTVNSSSSSNPTWTSTLLVRYARIFALYL